jgi:hypothetical protein
MGDEDWTMYMNMWMRDGDASNTNWVEGYEILDGGDYYVPFDWTECCDTNGRWVLRQYNWYIPSYYGVPHDFVASMLGRWESAGYDESAGTLQASMTWPLNGSYWHTD